MNPILILALIASLKQEVVLLQKEEVKTAVPTSSAPYENITNLVPANPQVLGGTGLITETSTPITQPTLTLNGNTYADTQANMTAIDDYEAVQTACNQWNWNALESLDAGQTLPYWNPPVSSFNEWADDCAVLEGITQDQLSAPLSYGNQ